MQGSNLARGTWHLDPQPDGSFIMRSRSNVFSYFNGTVSRITGTTAHGCASNGNTNMILLPQASNTNPLRVRMTDPLMSQNAVTATIWKSERVILESLAAGGNMLTVCGGSAITSNYLGTQNPSAPMTLVPPLACRAVCGAQTFSLKAGTKYLTATASGQVRMLEDGDAGFTPEGASFIAQRNSAQGGTGWLIFPASGYANGWVLTRSATRAAADGTCLLGSTNNGFTLSFAPIPAGGVTRSHLWNVQWEDGSGDITSFPATAMVGAPTCPTASVTPFATVTSSPSPTSSNTPSSSETPSNTPSTSGTQVVSLSNTPSISVTASITPSSTASTSVSATSTPTPTSSSPIRIAGKLWIDLNANDFVAGDIPNNIPPVWNNRAVTNGA